MDIQKDRFMRHLTLFILCFIFIACERASLKRAENLLNFSLNNSVCFLQKHEYWDDFNGNGFRVEVYNILDMNYIRNMSEKSHLKSFNCNKSTTQLEIVSLVNLLITVQVSIRQYGKVTI